MSGGFGRWESDPLFSAAEVVQDSADRMESAFRTLSHEQSLAQGETSDSKLLNLMTYHRRDLMTALETTKWQLEDFERAVNFAALSDKSNSRENAIAKHRQFIRAIKEQIVQVEKSVEDSSVDDFNRNSQLMNSNEQDTVELALFLSGGDSRDYNLHRDSGSSIMRRFLDSTTDSDEIVELKTEVEPLPMNRPKHSYNGHDSATKRDMLWNAGSSYSKRFDIEAPVFFRVPAGLEQREESYITSGCSNLKLGDSVANCYSYRNRLRESVLGFLRNIWLTNKTKGSFTKRRKDGEVTDNIEDVGQMMSSSAANLRAAEQSKYVWMNWTSLFRVCERLNLEQLRTIMKFNTLLEVIQRRIRRSQYLILYNRFPIRLASAVLVMLIILGRYMPPSASPLFRLTIETVGKNLPERMSTWRQPSKIGATNLTQSP